MENPTAAAEGARPPHLTGRRALVTGGRRGLGRAIADRLSRAGAGITIVDLAAPAARSDLPGDWTVADIDLAAAAAEDELSKLAGGLGSLDVLVANAGVVPPWRGIAALDRDEWRRVFDTNVLGAALTLKAFAPLLRASDRGSAVLMASINGYSAHPEQALYTATKHAVIGLMRAAALDLGRDGVRVNAVAPGPIATEALQARVATRHAAGGPAPDAAFAAMAAETALGTMATPAMVADAVLFLASDLAAGVTGTVLPVECGLGRTHP